MDTLIEKEVKAKKRKTGVVIVIAVVIIIALVSWSLRIVFVPTLSKKDFVTAIVETGDIENTISATGEVLPEFEEVITSPINASVQNVLLDAGTQVKAGESVLTLDKSSSQTEYEKLKYELETK